MVDKHLEKQQVKDIMRPKFSLDLYNFVKEVEVGSLISKCMRGEINKETCKIWKGAMMPQYLLWISKSMLINTLKTLYPPPPPKHFCLKKFIVTSHQNRLYVCLQIKLQNCAY
jgi:hypothetical protein